MDIKTLLITFENIGIARRDIPKIRGYIANKYPEIDQLHNHTKEGFIYRYPMIQYKQINGKPGIIAIGEGIGIINEIENKLESFVLKDKKINIYEKGIKFYNSKYGIASNLVKYIFISPWMCLNQINYEKYKQCDGNQGLDLLKKILIGNILSMSKGFSYNVKEQINAYINLNPCEINFKNNKMIGFKGEFLCNFYIPNYWGIGKSVSRGFGTLKVSEQFEFK